ncbi:MAG TPA: saccharopine dehydrogenase [Pseudonocardiaceae bacterium]|jgi:saccharopine dehydrogenase (NAD+, L-lysine-forming)|nr:saccharopine dehydrogenase [Pseudonocardiaceae bacterium]
MTGTPRLWIRHEMRPTERRTPLVPADARSLVDSGVQVTVEDSPQRVFPISDYAAAGCRIAEPGSWVDAPGDEFIIGLKELPDAPAALRHRHVFFGHAYKGQCGARQLLHRFTAGGGTLFDLEYLVDCRGHRLAAFGYWAGYAGAALAVLHHRGHLNSPLRPLAKESLDAALAAALPEPPPRALVTGAFGRCGRGAQAALAVAGIRPTCWGLEHTWELDRAALLAHDILVNAVLITTPVPPFLIPADLGNPDRRLTVVSDVTCDVTSACNMLPINDRTTSWAAPVRRLRDGAGPLDIIAIDNLPSLLPREASIAFSAALLPHLRSLGTSAPWQRCQQTFQAELTRAG